MHHSFISLCPIFPTELTLSLLCRACIGQRFARLELYMLAYKVVQRYRLEYHHQPIDIDYTGLGHPDKDVRIRLIPRN